MAVFNQLCRGFSGLGSRDFLRASVSATALVGCVLPVAAWAQAASKSDVQASDDEISEQNAIIVTGIRASLQGARARKRDAEQVMDSITAQDIGALPDRSVSEALQRVPGVTLQRTSDNRDPARLSGEGGGVFIRGLSFVRSELNGRDVFSAANGRALSFEDISSDLLSGVDVYKNPTADMVEGGIGGTINLRTRKPFDAPGFVAAFSGDINYADLRKKSFLSGNALISDRWDTSLGEIGVLVSYSVSNIGNRTDSISTGRYVPTSVSADDAAASGGSLTEGETVYIPNSMGYRRIDWSQKRTAFDGSIQWRPSDTLTFTGEALISKASPHDLEYAMGDWSQPETYNPSYVYGSAGELVSGVAQNRQLNMDTRAGSQNKKTQDYSFKAEWVPDSHWTFSTDVQYVKSSATVYSMTAFTGVSVPATFDFDYSGNDPKLNIYPTDPSQSFADKSVNWWAAAMDHLEDNEADQWAWRGDAEYRFDNSFLKSIKVGARWTDRHAITRQTGYNWSVLSAQYWLPGNEVYLDQAAPGGPSDLPDQTQFVTFPDFFRGEVGNPTSGLWFPSGSLVNQGTGHAYDYLQATETNGWGWTPLSNDFSETTGGGGINDQTQKTWAGYAMARFGMDESPIGRFDGNIGVRVVHTKAAAVGSAASIGTVSVNCDPTTTDCTDYNTAVAFIAGDLASQETSGKNSYTDVLPSLNLRYFASNNLQIRFAVSKSIARPSFTQLNPYTSLSFSFNPDGTPSGTGVGGRTTAFTGTAGNPDLKPTRATNYDLSFEYYYGRSNSLTLGLFYKDIKDYIFAGLVEQSYTSNGQTVTFDVTRQTNGSHGTIKGAELAYTQFFDFLPGALSGFGFSGNVTYVDSTGGKNTAVNVFDTNQTTNAGLELPLEGLSKWSYNVAGIYEKHGISARVAYNWRSSYLLTTSAANINYPVWADSYGQLDASFLVSVGDHFKIGLQGTNLLTSRTFLRVGDPNLKPRYSWTETDRRVAMVVRTLF
ncbi:TonB-dependent receptor [Novosphingobium malaysiense]|uniref:TonB-dependent receptor n=1 Tax=Novosphingobium malaysiense TaxID=1348853 RepID=A0A0B1ZQM7_9SPHN|nr:TonB-dependent receptor [Novosphingobium malaysiense]KHK92901.1 TonB-dependent receptor [Novosphingobium malaysiense]